MSRGRCVTGACVLRSPNGELCPGRQACTLGALSTCQADRERCDGIDNDCDGITDEGFRDARGAYSLNAAHCSAGGYELVGGGDPFAPSCALDCPDLHDGLQVGDRLDADRSVDTGCEWIVRSLSDPPGADSAGTPLDANCDGADGVVQDSY